MANLEKLLQQSRVRHLQKRKKEERLKKTISSKIKLDYRKHLIEEDPREIILGNIVKSGDCWIWIRAKDDKGYGAARYKGEHWRAHRLSYTLFKGEITKDKPYVCHSCDTPSCVNPDHLFLGTHFDNMKDLMKKKRYMNAQYNEIELADIDVLKAAVYCKEHPKARAEDIMNQFDVTRQMVRDFKKGKIVLQLPKEYNAMK